jgi:hypothetical protein
VPTDLLEEFGVNRLVLNLIAAVTFSGQFDIVQEQFLLLPDLD